jgi:hypothetical protein
MGDDQLRLYRTLSRAPFPKNYVGKVFLTAFFGTHVPLLALLVYLCARPALRVGGCAAHTVGHGASHAGRDGYDALGDVLAL